MRTSSDPRAAVLDYSSVVEGVVEAAQLGHGRLSQQRARPSRDAARPSSARRTRRSPCAAAGRAAGPRRPPITREAPPTRAPSPPQLARHGVAPGSSPHQQTRPSSRTCRCRRAAPARRYRRPILSLNRWRATACTWRSRRSRPSSCRAARRSARRRARRRGRAACAARRGR